MVNLLPFKAGLEAAIKQMPIYCADPRSAFIDVLQSYNFKPPKALQIGNIDRIDGPEDRHNKQSGWYIYNEIEDTENEGAIIGFGSFGCWKTGINEKWSSRSEHLMSEKERKNYHIKREAMQAAHEIEKQERQMQAAKRAYDIWVNARKAQAHPYLTKKKIKPCTGLKIGKDDRLIIPIAINDQITSLQFIDSAGQKRFLTGGKKKGGYFFIEGDNAIVYITEGFSTGASIYEATGNTVYIAFDAGNLYEVAAHVKNTYLNSRIIIAGDDDTQNEINTGRANAQQAAGGLNIEVIFPPEGINDFNDLHVEKGLDFLKKFLSPKTSEFIDVYKPDQAILDKKITRPKGFLGDVFDYYNATSGNKQEGFAIQTALALGSILLGRSFKTNLENFTSLYLLNVGKSSTGKEHAKTIIEKILFNSGLGYLIAGDGYTSAGAVFSTLLDRPKHITVIDEFGRYLEAGRDLKRGNLHQREANTKLMEAISRSHSVIRPPSYSSMTLKKDAADAIKNRFIQNPSITMLAMTTPSTLFKTLNVEAIKDGFINRFIISISDAERDIRRHKAPIDVPERISQWVKTIITRNDKIHMASDPAEPVVIQFSKEADDMQVEFQKYVNVELPNKLEKFGMAELSGRSNEMAMKISLIVALSRDPNAKIIEGEDMQWAIDYVRQNLDKTAALLKVSLSSSDHEGDKKEVLSEIRKTGDAGITFAQMIKTPPYSKHPRKYLSDILDSLKEADLVIDEIDTQNKKGKPSKRWFALN